MKRAAHKEAWYGASANPFRRTRTGQSQSSDQTPNTVPDVEAGEGNFTQTLPQPIPEHSTPEAITSETSNSEPREKVADQSSEDTAIASTQPGLFNRIRHRKDGDVVPPSELQRETTTSSKKSKKSLKHKKFTVGNQIKGTIFNSWINILLIAAPVGIALNYTSVRENTPIAIFLVNFVAIIPLAALLSYATEELALRVGEVLGGLLNASFGFVILTCSTIFIVTDHDLVTPSN